MRRIVLAALGAATLCTTAVPALADGPSGSREGSNNQVTCDDHHRDPSSANVVQRNGGVVVQGNTGTTYTGTRGVEACGDNGGSWRGRAIVTTDQGGYVAYDGAVVPGHPTTEDDGCYRVGVSGVHTDANGGDSSKKCR